MNEIPLRIPVDLAVCSKCGAYVEMSSTETHTQEHSRIDETLVTLMEEIIKIREILG